jgi:hypothetical protein
MNFCDTCKHISLTVHEFMSNVSDVKEESITDYLVWQWRKADPHFKYIKISTFTRLEESETTGADFELELWLVGKNFHIPLVFQAKKLVKEYDSYREKLNYPDRTQIQLKTLLDYATKNNRLPLYIFYTASNSKTKCIGDTLDTSLFIASAHTVKTFANKPKGETISKRNILEKCNPFHCIFCCPIGSISEYFKVYFPSLINSDNIDGNEPIPEYVNMLLTGDFTEVANQSNLRVIEQNNLKVFRFVSVYDMRENSSRV